MTAGEGVSRMTAGRVTAGKGVSMVTAGEGVSMVTAGKGVSMVTAGEGVSRMTAGESVLNSSNMATTSSKFFPSRNRLRFRSVSLNPIAINVVSSGDNEG